MAAGGTGLASAALLVACGGDDDDKTPQDASGLLTRPEDTSKQAKRGGTVKWWLAGEPSSIDPMPVDTPLMNNIKPLTYSTLLLEKPGYLGPHEYKELLPYIAESWEYSPDHLTLTLKIRQNVKFHNKPPVNGRTMDVEDIVASWDRYARIGNYNSVFANSVNPDAPIVSMKAVDSRTISVKLAAPNASLLSLLAQPFGGRYVVMPKETGTSYDPRRDIIGTGPFVLSNYEPAVGMNFKRNTDYWDDRPYVDQLDAPFLTDYANGVAQLKAGNLYTYGTVRATDLLTLKRETPDLRMYASEPSNFGTSAFRFGWQPAGQSPFRDERVRQAFSMAIDRDLFLDTFSEAPAFTAQGIAVNKYWSSSISVTPYWWLNPQGKDFGPNAKYFQFNAAEAKALMAAAGYANGVEAIAHRVQGLQYGPVYHTQSDVIDEMIKAVGFQVKPDPQDFTTIYLQRWLNANGRYDGFVHARSPSPGSHPASFYSSLYWSRGGIYFLGFDAQGKGDSAGDPRVDSMINKINTEFDAERQQSLGYELQRFLAKPMYGVLIPGQATSFLLAWPVLRNFHVEQGDNGRSGWGANHGVFSWWLDETQPPIRKT